MSLVVVAALLAGVAIALRAWSARHQPIPIPIDPPAGDDPEGRDPGNDR
jgi:hypothetical protein